MLVRIFSRGFSFFLPVEGIYGKSHDGFKLDVTTTTRPDEWLLAAQPG